MKDLPITMEPDGWMGKTGGYAKDMTLRDYFAAKAMQGFCTTLDQISGEPFWNVLASDAYKMADAMLKAREA